MNTNYTAVLKQDGAWGIGWIEEIPGVNCQEASRDELLDTLAVSSGVNKQNIADMQEAKLGQFTAGAPNINIKAPSVTSANSSSYNTQVVTRSLHHPDAMLVLVNAAK